MTVSGLCVMSSLSKIDSLGRTKIGIINLMPTKTTISARTRIAKFQILTSKQAAYLLPIHPSILEKQNNITSLIKENKEGHQKFFNDGLWFPTPENCPTDQVSLDYKKTIYETIHSFKQMEKLDPTHDKESRAKFLEKFNWTDSAFNQQEKQNAKPLSKIPLNFRTPSVRFRQKHRLSHQANT